MWTALCISCCPLRCALIVLRTFCRSRPTRAQWRRVAAKMRHLRRSRLVVAATAVDVVLLGRSGYIGRRRVTSNTSGSLHAAQPCGCDWQLADNNKNASYRKRCTRFWVQAVVYHGHSNSLVWRYSTVHVFYYCCDYISISQLFPNWDFMEYVTACVFNISPFLFRQLKL